jgi:RNA recognition motif-containing protein
MDAESKLSSRQLLDKTIIAALFSTAALKQFRLIVRNLAWETTVEDLQTLFGKCGKLYEVHIPAGKTPGTSRGFAFVNYTNATDAQKAVQLCNKQNIRGRAIAVDITIPKEQYDAAVASEKVAQAEIDALCVLDTL